MNLIVLVSLAFTFRVGQLRFSKLKSKQVVFFMQYILFGLCLTVTLSKLLSTTVLFRHGARYPVSDIFDGAETKPLHGKLTSVGLRQQYLLGSYFKHDYIDTLKLLSPVFDPNEVQVITDSTERCQESAAAHMQGMFPSPQGPNVPSGLDPKYLLPPFKLSSEIFFYPSLHSEALVDISEEKNNLYCSLPECIQVIPIRQNTNIFAKCPDETNILAKRVEALSKILAQFQVEQTAFTEKMRLVFQLPANLANIAGLVELYDVVVCDLYLGRPMPAQFTESDERQLRFIQSYIFVSVYGGEPAKVFSTPFVTVILDGMQKAISGSSRKKLLVLSGHDTNVVPMTSFFNLTSAECIRKRFRNETVKGNCAVVVPFASNIIFQLHQSDTDPKSHSVRIRYNGDYFGMCETDKLDCPYDQFVTRVKRQMVDFKKECGVK